MKGILSMWSGTAVGLEIPCEKQYDPLCILLCYLCSQVGASQRRDHVLQFANKKIEARHGRYHVFSIWKGVGVGRKGEIVPVQFRKVCGV